MNLFRIATFNAENLFTRSDFLDGGTRPSERRVGMVTFEDPAELRAARRIAEATLSRIERQLTAQVILDADADFVALQEVDNRAALELFRDEFIHPHWAPRLGRALQGEVRRLHAEADRRFGPEEEASARRIWIAAALQDVRDRIEKTLYYDHFEVIEGNDRRGIDLGFLSRVKPSGLRSYAGFSYEDAGLWNADLARLLEQDWKGHGGSAPPPDGSARVFRRDVVAVDLDIGGRPLTLFNVHFKSNGSGGAEKIFRIREAEVKALAAIIRRRFRDPARANWVLCGDFNDYVEIDGSSAIYSLRTGQAHRTTLGPLEALGAFDVCRWIEDPLDRWTTYFPAEDVHTQLDHIFLSPALYAANDDLPADLRRLRLIREGLPWSIPRGPQRYPGVGIDEPKASDHAAIALTIRVP